MTTLDGLTNPIAKHLLPCKLTVATHKLLTKDYQACLQQYGYFIEAMAIATETPEPTTDDIRMFMPAVMMEVYTTYTGVGAVAIESFFKIFTDDLTPEIIANFDLSDFEMMWQIIYEGNRIPFEMRLRLLVNGGAIKTAMERYKEAMATMNSSTHSSELDSIPATEPSKSNTRLPLLKSKSNTKTKPAQKRASIRV